MIKRSAADMAMMPKGYSMKRLKKMLLILSIVLCCVGCDQVSKKVAKQRLEGRPAISWGDGMFRLQYAENPGAWLSLGADWPDSVRFWVFIVLPGVVLCGLTFADVFTSTLSYKELIAFSLFMGGGWSNLLDRIGRQGHVIDFLNFGIGSIRTGIFNVADVLILFGVGGLLLFRFSAHKNPKKIEGMEQ